MLEGQIMLKQSQEHQRQKGVQESNDPREQNVINQQSLKHDKYALLNTGIRVRDPSQMFIFGDTNWVRGSSNALTHSAFTGALTKHISQQAGTFSRSSSSVNQNLEQNSLSHKEDDISLGTKSFKNMAAPNSSDNAFELLRKVDKGQTYPVSINKVPRSESDDAFTPLNLNKPSQSPKHENNRLSNQNCMKSCLVLVKKEEGQTQSTQPEKIRLKARVQRNPSVTGSCEIPSTSYAAGSRIRKKSSVHLKKLDVNKRNARSLKSKKRKFSAFERLPWHKEVTEGSSRLLDISSTELEGVRRPKKLKKLAEDAADSSCINRKRRLDLTTELTQVLFQPPPATVLSQDAIKHFDIVAYYASRLALGDACSLCARGRRNMTSKSSSYQDLLKIITAFIDRSKRLQVAISRLEKKRSVIREVKMDSQDLEKFSILSRLAKLHTRRPTVTGDTSTSTAPKPDPQRYVKPCPMPKMVPEGQNCLLLL